jgi:hypothetical protein
MLALPTIRNTAVYDLVVVTPDGTKHANIQVKTSFKRISSFPMPLSKDSRGSPRLLRRSYEIRGT